MISLLRKVPPAVWIIAAVVGVHLLAFWLLADKHFLPKTRYLPPPTPEVNFAAGAHTSVDPQTGAVTTEQEFTVSTLLVTPPPPAAAPPAARK